MNWSLKVVLHRYISFHDDLRHFVPPFGDDPDDSSLELPLCQTPSNNSRILSFRVEKAPTGVRDPFGGWARAPSEYSLSPMASQKGNPAVNHFAPKVYQSKMPRQPAGAAWRRVAASTRSARDLASRTPREVAHTRSCRFILRRGETRRLVSPRRRSVPGHPVSAGSVSR